VKKFLQSIVFALVLVACGDGRLSPQGGTVTGASPNGGLVLTSGRLGLVTSCADEEVLVWDDGGSAWACGPAGETYTAGDGLTLTAGDFDVVCGTGLTCGADIVSLAAGFAFSTANTVPMGDGVGLTSSPITVSGTDTTVPSLITNKASLGFGVQPAALAAAPTETTDWDPWSGGTRYGLVRVSTATAGSILASLDGGTQGDIVILENHGDSSGTYGTGPLLIRHHKTGDVGVTVGNNIYCPNLRDIVIPYTGSAILYYDSPTVGWIMLGTAQGERAYHLVAHEMSIADPLTPSALSTGETNDYNPTGGMFGDGQASSTWLRINAHASGSTLTGIVPYWIGSTGSQGPIRMIQAIGGPLTLANEDTSSSAANRFNFPGGKDITIGAGESILIIYDQQGGGSLVSARWRLFGVSGGSFATLTLNRDETPATLAGSEHNWNPTDWKNASVWRVEPSATTMTGMTEVESGAIRVLTAYGNNLTFAHQSGSSSTRNQFYNPGAADYTINVGESAIFRYDGAFGAWFTIGRAGKSYTAGDGLTLTSGDFDLTYTSDFTITADALDLSTAVTAPGTIDAVSTITTGGALAISRGAAQNIVLSFTQTGQTAWELYQPASNSDLRFWNNVNSDVCTLTTAGILDCDGLSTSGGLSVTGTTTLGALHGTVQTDAGLAGTVSNHTLNASTSVLRLQHVSDIVLTGLTGGVDGRVVVLQNDSLAAIRIDSNTVSTAANQFYLTANTNKVLNSHEQLILVYNGNQSRWEVTGSPLRFGSVYSDTTITSLGNVTSGDAAGDVFDHNGDIAKFGISSGDGSTYINSNQINYGYGVSASNFTGAINYYGFGASNTYDRNLNIYDGKTNLIASFTGSTRATAFTGGVALGDAGGDAHVVNGTIDFNHAANMDSTLTLSPMTSGSLLFAGTGGLVSQDNANLFWDDSNNWLGIGTASPAVRLHVVDSTAGGAAMILRHSAATGYSAVNLHNSADALLGAFGYANASVGVTHLQSQLYLASFGPDWQFANGTRNEVTVGMTTGSTFMQMQNGSSAAISVANTGRIRYNSTGQKFQLSANGAAYADFVTSAAAVGVANTVPKWTAANALGLSTITDTGSLVTVTNPLTVTGLLTATSGGTTPANWTTTGTGDLVSADDLTVGDDATVTDFLQVNGSAAVAQSTTLGDSSASDTTTVNGTLFARRASGAAGIVMGDASAKDWTWYLSGNDVRLYEYTTIFGTGGTDRVTFEAGGEVGIGDMTPDALLDVAGTFQNDGDARLGDASTDRVGIGTAPDSNHAMTFAGAVGAKIALFPVSGTGAYGFGVQSNQLQYFTETSSNYHSFGYGDSDAFTEAARIDADGQVWLGKTTNTNALDKDVILTVGLSARTAGSGGVTTFKGVQIDGATFADTTLQPLQTYGLYIDNDSTYQTTESPSGVSNTGVYISASSATDGGVMKGAEIVMTDGCTGCVGIDINYTGAGAGIDIAHSGAGGNNGYGQTIAMAGAYTGSTYSHGLYIDNDATGGLGHYAIYTDTGAVRFGGSVTSVGHLSTSTFGTSGAATVGAGLGVTGALSVTGSITDSDSAVTIADTFLANGSTFDVDSATVDFNQNSSEITTVHGRFFYGDSDGFRHTGQINGWNVIRKESNQDVTNLGVTNDDDFTFSVTAGKTYTVELQLIVSGSDATGDYIYDFATSAGTMDGKGHQISVTTADAIQSSLITVSAAADTSDTSVGTLANVAIPIAVTVKFTFRQVTSSGTFRFRFGNASAAGGRISRTWAQSEMRYRQLD
jgi:hypothetical protein